MDQFEYVEVSDIISEGITLSISELVPVIVESTELMVEEGSLQASTPGGGDDIVSMIVVVDKYSVKVVVSLTAPTIAKEVKYNDEYLIMKDYS